MVKYPGLIEIRHSYHPLRGFIVDDSFARFRSEENVHDYKAGELHESVRFFFEIYSREWIQWLQSVFWRLYRTSNTYENRLKEIEKLK